MKKSTKKDFKNIEEFDNHFKIIRLKDKKVKLEGYIVIHRKVKNKPSFGATRFLNYRLKEDAFRDALRLSKLMSYKSAIAGLPYGGAKAVIIKPKGNFSREDIFKSYANKLNKLSGDFITGTDVGVYLSDLKLIKKYTNYIVGFSSEPEKYTAQGVLNSIKVALDHVYKSHIYKNYSFSIQGIGKVGFKLLDLLSKKGVKNIYVSDVDKSKLKQAKNKYPFIKILSPNEIYAKKVDVFCPCALSGVLNNQSIKKLKCKIIVGSANNQLKNEKVSENLHKLGILYCPDYLVNSGGLISVVDEFRYGNTENGRLSKSIDKISKNLSKILIESKKNNLSPHSITKSIYLSILNKVK